MICVVLVFTPIKLPNLQSMHRKIGMTHPPGDGLSLESISGKEAGLVPKLGGEEDGIGIDVGDKEEQELDDWKQQPGSVQPKNAWLQFVNVATP